MKIVLFALLFHCSIAFGQINLNNESHWESEIAVADSHLIFWSETYSSPYKGLQGSAYNDSLISISEIYPSGDLEVRFGDNDIPVDSLTNKQASKTIKWILKRWEDQMREKDEEYFSLLNTLIEFQKGLEEIQRIIKVE